MPSVVLSQAPKGASVQNNSSEMLTQHRFMAQQPVLRTEQSPDIIHVEMCQTLQKLPYLQFSNTIPSHAQLGTAPAPAAVLELHSQ